MQVHHECVSACRGRKKRVLDPGSNQTWVLGSMFIQGVKESLRPMREAMGDRGGWGRPELCGNKKLSDIKHSSSLS